MFNDRWKPLTRADPTGGSREKPAPHPPPPAPSRETKPRSGKESSGLTRHSNGLSQFFDHIQGTSGLRILDLSGASQANIGFITNLGHRLYSEDLLQSLDLAFGDGDFFANQEDPARMEAFLAQSFQFPDDHFDGVLAWDALEFLAPPLLKAVVDRLTRSVRSGSYLFALFHAEERAETIPAYHYRIADAQTVLLTSRGSRRPAQFFNNRAVEKVFEAFESVKFFLSRDALREVIVKR